MPRPTARFPLLAVLFAAPLAGCHDVVEPAAPPPASPTPTLAVAGPGWAATQLPLVPSGINDSGVIVGTVGSHAVRYHAAQLFELPRLPSLGGDYEAQAINRRGAIAGNVAGGIGLFWNSAATFPRLILPPQSTDYSLALTPAAINDADVVVGSFMHLDAQGRAFPHAFRWRPDGAAAEDITPPGYLYAYAVDVNDAGYAVGYGSVLNGHVEALRWAPWSGNQPEVLAGDFATATAVRPGGEALGTVDTFTATRRWLLTGLAAGLATPQYSSPDDVSGAGRIVGHTYGASPVNPRRPWTVLGSGQPTWLPVPNPTNTFEVRHVRVNGCGWIVARQEFLNGVVGGVLWTRALCDLGPVAP